MKNTMTNKKTKKTTKETKDVNQNDFRVVMEGKLKGRKELLKEKQTEDNPWNCEWDNVHGDVIHFR